MLHLYQQTSVVWMRPDAMGHFQKKSKTLCDFFFTMFLFFERGLSIPWTGVLFFLCLKKMLVYKDIISLSPPHLPSLSEEKKFYVLLLFSFVSCAATFWVFTFCQKNQSWSHNAIHTTNSNSYNSCNSTQLTQHVRAYTHRERRPC